MEYTKMTDAVSGKTFYLKAANETSQQIIWSQLPYIGRELFTQMEAERPEMLATKMEKPELFIAEIEKLARIYSEKAHSLTSNGLHYLEAMKESRRYVAAMLNL